MKHPDPQQSEHTMRWLRQPDILHTTYDELLLLPHPRALSRPLVSMKIMMELMTWFTWCIGVNSYSLTWVIMKKFRATAAFSGNRYPWSTSPLRLTPTEEQQSTTIGETVARHGLFFCGHGGRVGAEAHMQHLLSQGGHAL